MKSLVCLMLLGVVAMASAYPSWAGGYYPYGGYHHGYPYHAAGYHYWGYYPGHCAADGLYYNGPASFVVCSNGLATVQKCAPGSSNSGYQHFSYGQKYGYTDFCDVNNHALGYGK